MIEKLWQHDVGLVAMAGFMTFFAPDIFEVFEGRILNTHPSLLPNFKGAQAVRDALTAGAPFTGCTIHLATAKIDDGPILAQRQVTIYSDDTEETLHERIKKVERGLYPQIIREQLELLPA